MTARATKPAPKNTYLAQLDKELDAEKAWQLAGGDPDSRPATPGLDEVRARYELPKAKRTGNGRKPKSEPTVVFTVDGVRQGGSPSLGRLVWDHSAAAFGGGTRVPLKDARVVLAGLGVDDPEHTAWDVEVHPGVRWGAILMTDKSGLAAAAKVTVQAKPKAAAKPAAKSKPPAKTAAKPKVTPTTRTAAKRDGKTQVTPTPKGSPKPSRKSKLDDTKPDAPVPTPESSGDLAAQAAAERKALSAWRRGGEKGPQPSTAAIDALAAKNAAA